MSDTIKARYVGHPDGIEDFRVPVGTEGEQRRISLAHGQELPAEIDGLKVPAKFRDSLLQQKENWTRVKRGASEDDPPEDEEPEEQPEVPNDTSAAKADEKEA
jgi:hypothetical protein